MARKGPNGIRSLLPLSPSKMSKIPTKPPNKKPKKTATITYRPSTAPIRSAIFTSPSPMPPGQMSARRSKNTAAQAEPIRNSHQCFGSNAIAAVFLLLLALIWPGGMGLGDVKMALLMGAVLGRYVIVAVFLGFLFGGLVGILLILLGLRGRRDRIPFGPFLAMGSAVALLWGEKILTTYLTMYH